MKICIAVVIPLIAVVLGSCSEGPVAGDDLISVTGFTPESGPAGTVITISGSGFGSSPEEIGVFMKDTPLAIGLVTPERIEATIPEGAESGIIAVVREGVMMPREGITGRSERRFTVIPPADALTSVSPAAAAPGERITITGKGFGWREDAITLMIGSVQIVPDMVYDTLLRATLPLSLPAGPAPLTVRKEKTTLKGSLPFTVREMVLPPYISFEFSLGGVTATHASYYVRHMPDRSGHDTVTGSYAATGTVQCGTPACRFRTGDTLELSISNENVPPGSMLYTLNQVTIVLDTVTGRLRYLKYLKKSNQQTGTTTKSYGQHNLSEGFTIHDVAYQKLPDGSLRCTLDAAGLASAGLELNNSQYTLTADGAWGTRDLYESSMIGFDILPGASLTLTLKP